MDPEFVRLVEECERLAELRTDVAVSDRPPAALDRVDAEHDAAREALVRYVEGRVGKAVADGLSGERIYWLPECPEDGQRDINELMYLATENNAPPFVVRVERAVVLADGWVAVRPDPTDVDCLLVTEHETKEDATRALKGAPDA